MNKIIHPFFVVLITAFIIILTAVISAIEIPMAKKKIVDKIIIKSAKPELISKAIGKIVRGSIFKFENIKLMSLFEPINKFFYTFIQTNFGTPL